MTDIPGITLACFGLVGTLVVDGGAIELAFAEAIATQGVVTGTSAFARSMAAVHRARGQAPGDVLRAVFPDNQARAQAAQLAFDRSLAGAVERRVVHAVTGAREVLAGLAGAGCRICVMTIMARRELTMLLQVSGLRDQVSVALCADDVPRGCPFPDLALAAMLRTGVGEVGETLMVHATAAGVECGRRAGAGLVVGVLTGPHPAGRLQAAGAMHVIDSIADLPGVIAHGAPSATIPPQVAPEHRPTGV